MKDSTPTAASEPLPMDCLRTNDLTISEVRACGAFKQLTDEEALNVIDALKTFTKIVYDYYKNMPK